MHIVKPPGRLREVVALAMLVLLALAARILIVNAPPGGRWLALPIVMIFLGACIGVINRVSRRR